MFGICVHQNLSLENGRGSTWAPTEPAGHGEASGKWRIKQTRGSTLSNASLCGDLIRAFKTNALLIQIKIYLNVRLLS